MKPQNLLFSAGVALSTVLAVSTSAKAASFTTTFTPNPANPTQDIFLQSITQNGVVGTPGTNLFLVQSATILSNTPVTPGVPNTGAGSSDRGDNASNGNGGLPPTSTGVNTPENNPGNADITAYLGNLNLNNIVDTEDNGSFAYNLTFSDPVAASDGGRDNLFFYERGGNSDLRVQALDASGSLIGNAFTITRNLWSLAGYSINTLEIGGAQPVGSYGVSFAQLGLDALGITSISSIRVSADSSFNGPDFKVFGATLIQTPTVPEPTTMLGLGSVAALALLRRRQTKKGFSLKSSV